MNSRLITTLKSFYSIFIDGPGIESRWGRFSAPIQTGPGAHPASCTMGTLSFPGVKRPGRGADPTPSLQCRGLKNGRAIRLPTLRALVAYTGGTFTLHIHYFLLKHPRIPKYYCRQSTFLSHFDLRSAELHVWIFSLFCNDLTF